MLSSSSRKKALLTMALTTVAFLAIIGFAGAYSLISWLLGYSHSVVEGNRVAEFPELLYFSTVTITTLGYGDYLPLGYSKILAAIEALFGIVFIGYSISQVLSLRQSELVEYSVSYSIHQTYNECIDNITHAKESIADMRREVENDLHPEKFLFIYNRANPFYPALRALQITNGYSDHLLSIGKISDLSSHVERASHHVEELAGFTRKYLTTLTRKDLNYWSQPRTLMILKALCNQIDKFVDDFSVITKYASEEYKGGGVYHDIVKEIAADIRMLCEQKVPQ